jgi:hypothetical protein
MCAFGLRGMRTKSSWLSQEMACLSSLAGLMPRNEEPSYQAMYMCGKKEDPTVKLPVWAWRDGRSLRFHSWVASTTQCSLKDRWYGLGTKPSSRRELVSVDTMILVLYLGQEFLFYHQKESDTNEDPNNPATPWAQMIRWARHCLLSCSLPPHLLEIYFFYLFEHVLMFCSMYPSSRSRSMSDSERLIKQTYSVHVSLPADRAQGINRKWHISECLCDCYTAMPEIHFRSRIF